MENSVKVAGITVWGEDFNRDKKGPTVNFFVPSVTCAASIQLSVEEAKELSQVLKQKAEEIQLSDPLYWATDYLTKHRRTPVTDERYIDLQVDGMLISLGPSKNIWMVLRIDGPVDPKRGSYSLAPFDYIPENSEKRIRLDCIFGANAGVTQTVWEEELYASVRSGRAIYGIIQQP